MALNLTSTGPTRAAPPWAGDFRSPEALIRGGLTLIAAQFRAPDAVVAVVGAAGAAAAATSVSVGALSGPIPNGTVLDFGANKFARLTAAAVIGATSLTVAALPTALVDTDTATYQGTRSKSVPSGTAIGRTIAERDAGTGFGPAAAADEEIYLLAFDIPDVAALPDGVGYRPNHIVYENFVPGWAGLAGGLKDKLRALYRCTLAAD